MITNPNAPVFPTLPEHHAAKQDGQTPGLSKREHFAALALNGILSNSDITQRLATFASDSEELCAKFGNMAVEAAENLIAALNKDTSPPAAKEAPSGTNCAHDWRRYDHGGSKCSKCGATVPF